MKVLGCALIWSFLAHYRKTELGWIVVASQVLFSDQILCAAAEALRHMGGPESTPSGAAGLAGLLTVSPNVAWRGEQPLTKQSTVLIIATESAATAMHPVIQ